MSGSYVLPQELTPGSKARAAILSCPGATSFVMVVRTPTGGIAGSVYWERGVGTGASPQWDGNLRLVLPGTLVRTIACDAIRVWSVDAAAPQYIQIEADV